MTNKIRIVAPIALVLFYTVLMLIAGSYSKLTPFFHYSKHLYFNFQASYQTLLLGITAVSLVSTRCLDKGSFAQYFNLGNIVAPTEAMPIFGIKAGDGWLKTGLSLSLVISLVTGIFMYFQLIKTDVDWSLLSQGLGWILLFSLSNSFAEEMIFRLGLVSPLASLLSPMTAFIVSAVMFGLPHFAGMPSGLIGAAMAGLLGLVLAKSLFETRGFFWAWLIHFLQDVLIIGGLYLMAVKGA